MIFLPGRIRKPVALGFGVLLLAAAAQAAVRPAPEADAILEAARLNPLGQKVTLQARLRTASSVTPFSIRVDGAIFYLFENPEHEIILQLDEDSSRLLERTGGRQAAVKRARFDDAVRNTGISYEDLALRFLYWKNARLLGEDVVRTRQAWKIEMQAAGESSQYGAARLWIDQESGALLRVEGYDKQGRLIRRFEVISAQKIDGQWMLKQMRVETVDPESRKVTGRTYLEVTGKGEKRVAD